MTKSHDDHYFGMGNCGHCENKKYNHKQDDDKVLSIKKINLCPQTIIDYSFIREV